jgi:hypothetical protein
MAGWLIDKTPIIAVKYDLTRISRTGDAKLGFLGLNSADNSFISLIPGGLINGWLPEIKKDASTGSIVRKINVLLLAPVTVELCKKVAAFQIGPFVYKKQSELPYDGISTPSEWVFNLEFNGKTSVIAL